jgi:hypothetical protein
VYAATTPLDLLGEPSYPDVQKPTLLRNIPCVAGKAVLEEPELTAIIIIVVLKFFLKCHDT